MEEVKNKEKYNARRRELYAENPQKYIERSHNYYKNNKEKALKSQRNRWEKEKEEINRERRERYQNDKEYAESIKEKANDYYDENRHEIIEKNNKYSKSHRKEINLLRKNTYNNYKNILFEILGGKRCVKCGYAKDTRALQIDHINGGGRKDRGSKDMLVMLRRYVKNPEQAKKQLQILCANCNVIKSKTHRNEFGSNNRIYKNEKTPLKKLLANRKVDKKEMINRFKNRMFGVLGKTCKKCGYDEDINALQFDHIKAVGKKRVKGYSFYSYYGQNLEITRKNLQTLCANCNQIKKFENKEF